MVQGPAAFGVKLEDRIKIRRGLKARVSGGAVSCKTRMGRETAYGSNGEIKCVVQASSLPPPSPPLSLSPSTQIVLES